MILTDCNYACQQEVTPRSIHTIIAALAEQDMFFNNRHKTPNSRVITLVYGHLSFPHSLVLPPPKPNSFRCFVESLAFHHIFSAESRAVYWSVCTSVGEVTPEFLLAASLCGLCHDRVPPYLLRRKCAVRAISCPCV